MTKTQTVHPGSGDETYPGRVTRRTRGGYRLYPGSGDETYPGRVTRRTRPGYTLYPPLPYRERLERSTGETETSPLPLLAPLRREREGVGLFNSENSAGIGARVTR